MNRQTAYKQTWHTARHVCRYRRKTADAYAMQVAHFVRFCQEHQPTGTNEEKVAAWLSHCLPHLVTSTRSPLDDITPPTIVPFPTHAPVATRSSA